MSNLYKLLKEFKEARSAATPYEETPDSKCPECNLKTWGYRHWMGCNLMDKHQTWETLAANKSDKLIRIIEMLIEEIVEYSDLNHAPKLEQALQQAEKIAGENE